MIRMKIATLVFDFGGCDSLQQKYKGGSAGKAAGKPAGADK